MLVALPSVLASVTLQFVRGAALYVAAAACCGSSMWCTCSNDAGLAGAELALAVEQHTLGTGAVDSVGTTGIFEVLPNAVNSVPRDARLGIGEFVTAGGRCKHLSRCIWHP